MDPESRSGGESRTHVQDVIVGITEGDHEMGNVGVERSASAIGECGRLVRDTGECV